MGSNYAKKLKAVLAGLSVALLCAGSAQAAQYIGEWDPAFGNPFPNLGWQGNVTFFVPDACLSLGNNGATTVNNANQCSQGAMHLLLGNVFFYALDGNPSGLLSSLAFNASLTNLDQFIWVTVENGAVTGLKADFNQWVQSDPTLAIAGGENAWFNLSFDGSCAVLSYRKNNSGGGGIPSDKCDPTTGGGSFLHFTNLSAQVVPEPQTLALLIPVLGMFAMLRRRKPATSN